LVAEVIFYGTDVYGQMAQQYKLAEIIPEDYIIYGEIYGKRIQELNYGLQDKIDVIFFDVKYKEKYLDYDEFTKFCSERNLPIVPVLFKGKYNEDKVKIYTNGNTSSIFNTIHIQKSKVAYQIKEGCVVKSLKEETNLRIGRKSF